MRKRFKAAAAEAMFLCSFASPQLVFQTLKNCNFLFKVTKPFSSHSFFPSLAHWVQSRTILSTHKIRLLIFASWHLSCAAFQEGELWEMLSPTQHSAKLGWFLCVCVCVPGITQVSWTQTATQFLFLQSAKFKEVCHSSLIHSVLWPVDTSFLLTCIHWWF